MIKPEHMILSDKEGVRSLVMAAHHFGVERVIICPGSRNAPLTISFSRSGLFTCHSIPDERVAGFYALGMALATGKPVAVICTSGSAGVNLAPAIAEAFYLKAPVIAITADRPLSWTDQGNGQTIRQEGMFSNFIRQAFSLHAEPATDDESWFNRRKLSDAFNAAIVNDPGPVHINVPLAEPLYQTKDYEGIEPPLFYRSVRIENQPDEGSVNGCADLLNRTQKVMILAGQLRPDAKLNQILNDFASKSNVVVLSETTSNISGPDIITTIDRLIMPVKSQVKLNSMMPDILITIGGMVVSKKIKALLRAHRHVQHWHVHMHDHGLDTYKHLSKEFKCDPANFLEKLLKRMGPSQPAGYRDTWKTLRQLGSDGHDSYMKNLPFSDFKAFAMLHESLPENIVLHMANSSPVRYVQLFGNRKNTVYHSNRGTSGIDGCTSTAAGWAMANPEKQHVLITGDVAFLYDSNALWNNSFPKNLKIVVINNQGGGIFRIIEGAEHVDELETFFEAHHEVGIKALAAAFNIPYLAASNAETLSESIGIFNASQGAAILEIRTPGKENAPILKGYFKHIHSFFRTSETVKSSEPKSA